MEDSSSFFTTPRTPEPGEPVPMELVHSSEEGFCDIFRIDRMGRFRVLKCLKPAFRGDPLYENLLRKEFELGYALSHPNICEYYAFTPVEGLGNCIEMEWIDGRTMEEIISGEKPDPALCDKWLDEICDALSYTHSKQILHRDLKPSNILVTHSGENVKIIDFGFSDSDSHSILKVPAGTVSYTAPEVLAGDKADIRSDIYSFGLILYGLTKRHRAVARKCCEKRPGRRYSSMAEVKNALHSNSTLYAGVAFLLLVALMALLPYLGDGRKAAETAVTAPADSVAVPVAPQEGASTPADASAAPQGSPTPPTQPKAASRPAAAKDGGKSEETTIDASAIDELFREASDLFE